MVMLKTMAKENLPGSMVPEYGREEIRDDAASDAQGRWYGD